MQGRGRREVVGGAVLGADGGRDGKRRAVEGERVGGEIDEKGGKRRMKYKITRLT